MLNVEATATAMAGLTGYIFEDKMLCAESMQMASPQADVVFDNNFRGLDNNKRLTILGDAILEKVLCAAWYQARDSNGKKYSSTYWTALRKNLLSNDALAQRGYKYGIDKFIFVADGMYHSSPKMVATALEAIIGAVFQDGGDEAVLKVIRNFGFFDRRFLTVTLQFSHHGSHIRWSPSKW